MAVHFIGVGGGGVGALAQFHVLGGGGATGSDRSFDRGQAGELRARLEALGVRILPQDGSGLDRRPEYAVASTAVEEDNQDLARAREKGIEVRARPDELARHVLAHRTIAVAGTSGKSTVTAMLFEILSAAGKDPSLITGADLMSLRRRGLPASASRGKSGLLLIEADESDGSLVRYRPWAGVVLNLSKDHKDKDELAGLFAQFRSRCESFVVRAASPGLERLEAGSVTFGPAGEYRAEGLELRPDGSRFCVKGVEFSLPVPGAHNVENALAAAAAAGLAGAPLAAAARALCAFGGVVRRFEVVGSAGGVEVVDDFAHNPDKVSHALAAAQRRASRVLAVFQLHGFAPARLMRAEFIEAFSRALRPQDVLWMPEIYYAGGTAAKDVSAEGIAAEIAARGRDARVARERGGLAAEIARAAKPGDLVLVMGARDPTLPLFARDILKALEQRGVTS